jgi:hypothetical protein
MSGASKLRLLAWSAAGIVLVLGVAFLLLVSNIDGLVKDAIERYGSEAAGSAVQVADVRIDLKNGQGTVRGLTVANPEGFSDQPLFVLDQISITLDPLSLADPVTVIDELRIGTAVLRYELGPRGDSNLDRLRKTVHQRKVSVKPPQEQEERRLRIRRLIIADGEASLHLPGKGVGTATVRVPGTTLTDLGGKQGMTQPQLADAILGALADNLRKSATVSGLERLLGGKGEGAAGEVLRGLLDR